LISQNDKKNLTGKKVIPYDNQYQLPTTMPSALRAVG
jgi:hypothetical protein